VPTVTEDRRQEVLDEAECLALLGTASIGRVAFTAGALPAVQPVAFTVHRGEVLIPTQPGSEVAVASRGAVVAFEVDELDLIDRTGWTVTIVGPSRLIVDPGTVSALDDLGTRPWVPAATHCYVAVHIRLVGGRRVRRCPDTGSAPAGPEPGRGTPAAATAGVADPAR
jgi:hypothetical protein